MSIEVDWKKFHRKQEDGDLEYWGPIELKKHDQAAKSLHLLLGPGELSFTLQYPEAYPKGTYALSSSSKELHPLVEEFKKYLTKPDLPLMNILCHILEVFSTKIQNQGGEDFSEGSDFEEDDMFSTPSKAAPPPKEHRIDAEIEELRKKFHAGGSKQATDRILKDLLEISKDDPSKFGYSAAPVNDNLYNWKVELFDFEGELKKDLEKWAKKNKLPPHVILEMTFPESYPFAPPFIRVIKPRFAFHTGHITIGGSICMELLTTSGWSPSNNVESILVQIRANILAGGARLDLNNSLEYQLHEAREAFRRVAAQHGWEK